MKIKLVVFCLFLLMLMPYALAQGNNSPTANGLPEDQLEIAEINSEEYPEAEEYTEEGYVEPKSLKAAIFIQNRAGNELDDYVEVLNDLLTTQLTGSDGFTIIDKSIVVNSFRASPNTDPITEKVIASLTKVAQGIKTESSVENALSNASATRIAQMLNADYLIVATITTYSQSTRSFNGANTSYGISGDVTNITLRISLKVLEGIDGASLASDLVTVSERFTQNEFNEVDEGYFAEVRDKLFEQAAVEISKKVLAKVDAVRNTVIKAVDTMEVTITSNVEGASVAIDGAVVGSVNSSFQVKPGMHTLTVAKERYVTREQPVFFNQSGQVINIALEYSAEGLARAEREQANKLADDIAREQSAAEVYAKKSEADAIREQSVAEAYAKKKEAEGKKKMLENSSVNVDLGGDIENLGVGGDFAVVPE